MTIPKKSILIRPFGLGDTRACYDMRREAFYQVFNRELSQDAVTAGADAYDSDAFGRLISGMMTFVAADGGSPVGFCTVRFHDATTAEILYLYVNIDHTKMGIGSRLIRHAEHSILRYHWAVERLFLDTAVPGYNRRFWEKMGFTVMTESVCTYPAGSVPALKPGKRVDHSK